MQLSVFGIMRKFIEQQLLRFPELVQSNLKAPGRFVRQSGQTRLGAVKIPVEQHLFRDSLQLLERLVPAALGHGHQPTGINEAMN